MRHLIPTVILAALLLAIPGAAHPAHAQTDRFCVVDSNYGEAFDENRQFLLRTLELIYRPNSPFLTGDRSLYGYYTSLISMRRYHEDQRAELPACAEDLNEATIDLIIATQDVVGVLVVQRANPASSYTLSLRNAQSHLDLRWQDYTAATRATPIRAFEDD